MTYIKSFVLIVLLLGCQKDLVISSDTFACNLTFSNNSESHPKKAQFEAAMKKVEDLVPGVQIAIRSKDGNIWLGANGYADIANDIPFQNCTRTMVGSVSKIHTAALIMQLQDEGILSINDPISDWLPAEMVAQIENADNATIKNLLNHTSGIKEYLAIHHWFTGLNTPSLNQPPTEKIQYIYNKDAEFPVGERFQYTNSNYVLLGLIIENARQMSYQKAEQLFIAEPLGFKNTLSGTTNDPIPTGITRPYLSDNNGNYIDIMPFAESIIAASGDIAIATNMQESLFFLEAVINHIIVSKTSLELMLKEEFPSPDTRLFGENISYGLGLRKLNNKYGLVIGHTGGITTYWSHIYHFPNDNVTIGVAFNGNSENGKVLLKLEEIVKELIDIAFA